MNLHIHTLNKQSANLDLQYGCLNPDRQKLLSEQGRAFIKACQEQGMSEQDIQAEITKKVNTLEGCNELVRNNVEAVAGCIGRTVTGRSVTPQAVREPQLLLMQELTRHDQEPLTKALAQYGFQLVKLATHETDNKERDMELHHGTAVFLRDPDEVLDLLDTRGLTVTNAEIESSRFSGAEKAKVMKKIAGRTTTVCTLKLKTQNLALIAGSVHLKGFDREQEEGDALAQSRLPGAAQHEIHMSQMMKYAQGMQDEHNIPVAAIVVGGDFNEDERFQTRVCQQSGRNISDEQYRLHIARKFGFVLPENPPDQVPVNIVSEQSEPIAQGQQIDFITVKKSQADCTLYMNYDAYRKQIEEGIDRYPSDHIMISTKLMIKPVKTQLPSKFSIQ